MIRRRLCVRAAAVWMAAWLCLACGDDRRAEVGEQARAWVDRLHDTTTAQTPASPFADSAFVDSLASSFTTDDWLYFWHEVENEQARRKQPEK